MSGPPDPKPSPLRILLVADYFGRDRATGTKRANAFAKHWSREPGVEVVALTCKKPHVAQNPPEAGELGDRVREVRIWWPDIIGWRSRLGAKLRGRRTAAGGESGGAAPVPDGADSGPQPRRLPFWKRPLRYLSDLMVIPDRHALWALTGIPRGCLMRRPHVVVATAPAFVNLIIGRWIAAFHRVPFIADFRDPWRGNPFRPHFEGSLDRWDASLERRTLRAPREIWVTTDAVRQEIASRPGADPNQHVAVIPNGYDEDEWAGLTRTRADDDQAIRIVHTGSLYGVRSPVPLLDDLGAVLPSLPAALRQRIEIRLIGPVDAELRQAADDRIREYALGPMVRFLPPVDGREALQEQVNADIGLLIGHDADHGSTQIPMKLYEYLRAGHPVLAYFDAASALAELARDEPGFAVHLADLHDPDQRRTLLAEMLNAMAGPSGLPGPREAEQFERGALVGRAFARLRAIP